MNSYVSISVDADIDIHDFIYECSNTQKQEIAELLSSKGILPKKIRAEFLFEPESTTQEMLKKLILRLWDERKILSMQDVEFLERVMEDRKMI